ncbi:MAG: DNA recombination/repair protein RecA, partial [Oscillospiraceae bacterium]|nr:DNA recombination/repair protein RecA [Oscillospiraceae bacterium]
KEGGEIIGSRTKCKIVKNKVAPPFKSCEFDMIYGKGISKMGEVVDMGVELGIIKKSGSWFSYNDMRIGQGRESVMKWLPENPDVLDEIEKKIREQADALFLGQSEDEESEGGDAAAEAPAAEEGAAPAKAPAKKGGKKNVVVEAEEDFEEFSIDEDD